MRLNLMSSLVHLPKSNFGIYISCQGFLSGVRFPQFELCKSNLVLLMLFDRCSILVPCLLEIFNQAVVSAR